MPAKIQMLAFVVTSLSLLWIEVPVWMDPAARSERLNGWLSGLEAQGLPYVPFLLLFPLCWFGFRAKSRPRKWSHFVGKLLIESPHSEKTSLGTACALAFIVFASAFAMSYRSGLEFSNLPPAYHDEYSYSLQARLFCEGKWSAPSFPDEPVLFDQLHVLNEGKFASRYFPGTALWMTFFTFPGVPWLGHQLAQAICAMLIFWTGRELTNSGTGLLAGLLFAFSPGLILFSSLLLGHHPTLLGLAFFLWNFLRMMRTSSMLNAVLSGGGLGFAMLCRPMTAAGFALPFGIVFVWWWMTGQWRPKDQTVLNPIQFPVRTRYVVAMAIPLLTGFVVLGIQNKAITGSVLKSPYDLYNDLYTPRHVYGFNNAVRGDRDAGPLVSEGYDRWAENLTPKLAFTNVLTRFVSSWKSTLAILPLIASTVVYLLTRKAGAPRWQLLGLSILSLHLAHVPYWFTGIMGWHYVFESAPLWLLIFAEATHRLFRQWNQSGHWMMKYCWLFFLGTAITTSLWTIEPLWPARLARGTIEIKYPRQLYANFREQIEVLRAGQPAIVFVLPDLDDVSMDYVTNFPDWEQSVLVARLADRGKLNQYARLFPDRVVLLFDAHNRTFEIAPESSKQSRNLK